MAGVTQPCHDSGHWWLVPIHTLTRQPRVPLIEGMAVNSPNKGGDRKPPPLLEKWLEPTHQLRWLGWISGPPQSKGGWETTQPSTTTILVGLD
jgi:hypothetical protein